MTTVRKPGIPTPNAIPQELAPMLLSLKEWVEVVQGLRGTGKIDKLDSSASLSDVIAKVNEIIEVLQ